MQTALGRKGDYTVRAMLYLARHADDGRQKARTVAAAMEIPDRYAAQILANLVAHGLLVATAGPDGGYELARPSENISLLEVVEAAEGAIALERCVLQGGACEWIETCPIHEAWSRAQQAMVDQLARTSFADLAAIDAAIVAGTYRLPDDTPPHERPTRRGGSR
jgi:Rrf2 family transcriptional regulator, iron-sulfur cluster assembly transcription factor